MSDDLQRPQEQTGILADATTTAAAGAAGLGLGLITSPFRSRLFKLALLAMIASAGWLAYRAAFGGTGVQTTPDSVAPWLLRLSISFAAAFVFASLLRRALKLAVLVGVALVGCVYAAHKLGLGVTAADVENVKHQAADAATAAQHAADGWWAAAKPYLPSSGAAGVGLWRGSKGT